MIPSVKNIDKANFLFKKVDKCCKRFLTLAILNLQCDEINQSVYYVANVIDRDDIGAINNEEFYKNECVDSPQATINQLLEVSSQNGVKKIWSVQEKKDHLEQRMNILDKKIMYGTLHGTYKKALRKALQNRLKSLRLIEVLEDFANKNSECEFEDESDEESKDSGCSDKKNEFQLRNPKIRRGKGRPVGTRRFKASHESDKTIAKASISE
ncbi:hypothetical protein C1645_825755 [Glomus cerebriforme]|uniref:Uncharacterized protein n=1 Tax=Glomus cerebriforme TaxID=658196 RepID=A0A397SSX7_9GLOM|nr:hypothetical protein C1645_825755 [Glomus cerebriforme]